MPEAAEVLREIHDERALNIAHLSRRFGTSLEAIQELVGSLRAQGYLEIVNPACSNDYSSCPCRFCPLRTSCSKPARVGIKIYRISEKGLRLIGDQNA